MAHPAEFDGPLAKPVLGLMALSTDETLEPEIGPLIPAEGCLYVTRLEAAADVSAAGLAAMGDGIAQSAGRLPPALPYAAIGFGCTSATAVIGRDRIAELIRSRVEVEHIVNPLDATIAACQTLGVTTIGFVSPYVPEVSAAAISALEAAGLTIRHSTSFEIAEEAKVARITAASTLSALETVAPGCDAVFASCTNLRSFSILSEAEDRLGIPVLSSNLCLSWALLSAAGAPLPRISRLMESGA